MKNRSIFDDNSDNLDEGELVYACEYDLLLSTGYGNIQEPDLIGARVLLLGNTRQHFYYYREITPVMLLREL